LTQAFKQPDEPNEPNKQFRCQARVNKSVFFLIISGGVLLFDQLSKALVLERLPLYHSIPIIPGFFSLTHIHNPGGAFGFMAGNDSSLRHYLFLAASLAALVLILYYYKTTPRSHRFLSAALAMIFGGAVGNLIDRLRMGEVVDFLDVYIGQLHWPAFNVADGAITVGIGIFIYHLLFKKMPQ
jgi:signal peptidase II